MSTLGIVAWLTGLPSSGKTTLGTEVAAALRGQGIPVIELDGDVVRGALVPSPGYDAQGRADFYETLGRLAALLAHQGHVVVVAATASRAAFRAGARKLAPRFIEVFVDVPVEECSRRDAKGLYAAGTRSLPGLDAPYEAPLRPEIRVQSSGPAAVACVVEAIHAIVRPDGPHPELDVPGR